MNSRQVHSAFLFALSILGIYVVGCFVPSSLTWGFHALAFAPSWGLVVYIILAVLALITILKADIQNFLGRIATFMTRRPVFFLFISSLMFVVVAVLFRIQVPLLGDSYVFINIFENVLNGTHGLNPTRQPLAMIYFYALFKLLGAKSFSDIMTGFLLGELVLGVGFITFTFLTIREAFVDPLAQLLAFVFTLSIPYLQIFFGYVELYAVVLLAHAVFLFGVTSYLNKGTRFFFVPLLFLLEIASSYLSALLLLPTMLYLGYREYREHGVKDLLIGGGLMVVIVAIVLFAINFRYEFFIPRLEHSHLLSLSQGTDSFQAYPLFSIYHALDLFNYLLLMAPGAVFLLIFNLLNFRRSLTLKPLSICLLLIAMMLACFLLVVKFDLPMALDWDSAAPYFYFLAMLTAFVFLQSIDIHRIKVFCLIIAITLCTSMLYYEVNASTDPAISRAQLFLDRRIASQEGYYQSTFHLSMYFLSCRQTDTLVKLWKNYVDQFPDDGRGYEKLAKAYWEYGTGGFEDIIKTYELWIKKTDGNDDAKNRFSDFYFDAANFYYEQQRLTDATTYYWRAIDLTPKDPRAYNNLSLVYLTNNNPDSAIMCSLKAIELDSSYALGYKNLASAYAAKGDPRKAISSLRKALHYNPTYTRAYEQIADMYFALHQQDDAIENYQRAAQLGSMNAQKFLRDNGYSW